MNRDGAYWRHVLSGTLGLVEPRGELPDRLVVGDVGAVRVAELSASRSSGAHRVARHIRRDDRDVCKIELIAQGQGVIGQDRREAHLRAGDLTFIDLSRPAHWAMGPIRIVAVVFPRTLLPLPPREAARLTAVRIPGDHGTGALASTLARQLVRRLDEPSIAGGGVRLGAAVLDLLVVSLADQLDRPQLASPDTRQRVLAQQVQAFIERHLADRQLSPETIAAAHHISVRYLYTLFAAEGKGVASWVRQRRLERSRQDLLDPALRDRPVAAIAARWGFTSAAHFSRVFRAAHGLPPAAYRDLGRVG